MSGGVGDRRMLAQLQRAEVGDEAPTIARRNLRRVVGHDAEALGHDVEDVAHRRLLQALDVEGGRFTRESAGGNVAVAVPQSRMARRAINIEPATAALEIIFGNRKWHV